MLFKYEPKSQWFPEGYKSWRYWCECTDMKHTMELTKIGDEIQISISIGYKRTLWERIKMIWDLLFRGESICTDVFLCSCDRKEIASILADDSVP